MSFKIGDKAKTLDNGTIVRILEVMPYGADVFYRCENLETGEEFGPLLHQGALRPVPSSKLSNNA